MPELPEVETVVRGLRSKVIGREIQSLKSFREGTIIDLRDLHRDYGNIINIYRRGKYIILEMDSEIILLIHLRMTGKLIYLYKDKDISEHCRALMNLKGGYKILFDDVRTFGKIILIESSKLMEVLPQLGKEPLSEGFDLEYLAEQFKHRKASVKNVMLDQKVIAGLGNIYVAEILYRAGVSPVRQALSLSRKEIRSIVDHTRQVLKEAISKNGTTISDYRSVNDKSGEFQNYLKVYGKQQCDCGKPIKKIKQAGRTTYYCPHCQK